MYQDLWWEYVKVTDYFDEMLIEFKNHKHSNPKKKSVKKQKKN